MIPKADKEEEVEDDKKEDEEEEDEGLVDMKNVGIELDEYLVETDLE